jgi:hypothetical protein
LGPQTKVSRSKSRLISIQDEFKRPSIYHSHGNQIFHFYLFIFTLCFTSNVEQIFPCEDFCNLFNKIAMRQNSPQGEQTKKAHFSFQCSPMLSSVSYGFINTQNAIISEVLLLLFHYALTACCQYYSHILFRNRKLAAEKNYYYFSLSLTLFPPHDNYNSHLTLMKLDEFQLQSIFSFRN